VLYIKDQFTSFPNTKGFGIQFLPQYVEPLPPLSADTEKITDGVADDPSLQFDAIMERARSWTARFIQVLVNRNAAVKAFANAYTIIYIIAAADTTQEYPL
jgi:hypothetical protein